MAVIGAGVGSLVAPGPAAAPELRTAARPAPFAGVVSSDDDSTPTRVGCFGALSLRPTSSPVQIFEYHDAWSASPDGTRAALGISAPGRRARIGVRIVDLARGAIEFDVETGVAAEAVAWLTGRRLVAALQRGDIVVIDPVTGAIVRRWPGWAVLDAVAIRTRRKFVMLEPGRRVRRLVTVDETGRLRSVSLRFSPRERLRYRDRPALVADPLGEHAYVFTGGRTVVDVDLRRMRVRRHRLRPVARERTERRAKRGELRHREAIWLGGGRLAISGEDLSGRFLNRTVPAGLSTVDTDTWKVRKVDAKATGVALAGGRLLAHSQSGVRAYTLNGRRVFELLRGRRVWGVGTNGRLGYAVTDRATYVFDTGSGRVRRRISRALDVSVIARRCPSAR